MISAFIYCWHFGEKGSERWEKRLSKADIGWQEKGYKKRELDELAWHGDEGDAVGRKMGFYDNLSGGDTQWMDDRDRVAAYYFLRPSEIWLNDWQAF